MMNKIKFLLISLLFISSACSADFELLRSSVFIEDPEAPGLPQYSDFGYNTFGIYYERAPFISSESDIPIKVIVSEGNTTLYFDGIKQNLDSFANSDMKLEITIAGQSFDTYSQLIQWSGQSIDLASPGVTLTLTLDDKVTVLNVFDGSFNFESVKNMYVDDELKQVIMAGTFDFKAVIDGIPYAFFLGRYDLGVNEFNFFKL